ncbi:MAG: Wzz/FepE/Etk N-terminal domain-containing protein [bacterium]|nr:Wzz/FepE/Etk N-terminal domain-containing protein [bacterium]
MVYVLRTLVQWRKFILVSALLTAGGMAAISFVLPKWYTAVSSVFPPEPKSTMTSYMDVVQSLQLPILGPVASGPTPSTVYIDILLSRRVGSKIIEEFNLQEVFGIELMTETLVELRSHTDITIVDNGLLTIAYEDQDPERAAVITNRYVALLDEFNRELNSTKASRTRIFIEGQIERHLVDLREAEEDLKEFQKEHQALELDEQLKSSIEIISKLTADAITLEIELEIMRDYSSQKSEEYITTKRKYDEISRQLVKFQSRDARDEENTSVHAFFPAFDEAPDVMLEMARHIRRIRVGENIFEMLTQEYEKARIEEARDTPTVNVLDIAIVPELRSRPKRKILVLLGGIVGLGWSSILALIVAAWREDRQKNKVIRDVVEPINHDFRKLLRKKTR